MKELSNMAGNALVTVGGQGESLALKSFALLGLALLLMAVWRRGAAGARHLAWTVDCTSAAMADDSTGLSPEAQAIRLEATRQTPNANHQPAWANDLWLRNGDVIEVPEKP